MTETSFPSSPSVVIPVFKKWTLLDLARFRSILCIVNDRLVLMALCGGGGGGADDD